jgi:hypothetical protein
MQVRTPQRFERAHDAFYAPNDQNINPKKWAPIQNPAFNIPHSILIQASIEQYGQVNPFEELSPAGPFRDVREGSIPVEQLMNEALWPQQDQQLQEPHQPQQPQSPQRNAQEPSSKRRGTTNHKTTNQNQANNITQAQQNTSPQPPKRKRRRSKSQPQMVEAYIADGFPSHVASACPPHLEKNRVAAHKCRQRKKEYINNLDSCARELSSKNKALRANVVILRQEMLRIKNEILGHAGCGFWAIDEYLARCAGDLLGMEAPLMRTTGPRSLSQQDRAWNTQRLMGQHHNSTDLMFS